MADFDLKVALGTTLQKWVDPPGPNGEPSRLQPHPGREQLYYLGHVASLIIIHAVVNLVEAPDDSALGGRLFYAFQAEGVVPQILTSPLGMSARVSWLPSYPGHYVIGVRRPDGGAVLVPFDIAA
jgi:hypothetical protein